MIDAKTIDQLNSEPMSQQARALLKQAGSKPDPTGLYLTQLAKYGLDNGTLVQDHPQGINSATVLDQLALLSPAMAREAFTLLGSDLPDAPDEAASQLLESVMAWMVQQNPHWQSPAE